MKRFFLFMIMACLAVVAVQARTFVLVVGVSNYDDPNNNVQWTTASAKNFAKLMQGKTKDVSLLTSSNAGRDNVISKLTAIANRAQKGDRIIFFYSGHGQEGGLYVYNGVLAYNDINRILASSKATDKYCFIEACHSGTAAAAQPNSDAAKQSNITYFVGCRPDESAYVDPLIGGGVFSQGLIKGLRGKADANRDKQITVLELFKYAYGDVVNRKNKQQHPQLIGPKSMHNNVLMSW